MVAILHAFAHLSDSTAQARTTGLGRAVIILPLLVGMIASLYASDDLGPAQVNVCVPQEAIYLAMRALLSPGAHVVVTSPCYQSLYEVARAMGCELSHWR